MKVTPVNKNFNKHKLGEVFELPDRPALVLINAGLLREATTNREIVAETVATRTKRTYKRRDMQAQA